MSLFLESAASLATDINRCLPMLDNKSRKLLTYYLSLFRDVECIKKQFIKDEFPISVLEDVFFRIFKDAADRNADISSAEFDRVFFINDDNLYYQVLLNNQGKDERREFYYLLFSRLSKKYLDTFFGKYSDLQTFIEGFITLPEEDLKKIFTANSDLFGYLSMFLQCFSHPGAERFVSFFENSISEYGDSKKFVDIIYQNHNLEKEGALPFDQRNIERIKSIARYLITNKVQKDALVKHLNDEGALIDDFECSLINAVIDDPKMYSGLLL
jgi:hypothetical protein